MSSVLHDKSGPAHVQVYLPSAQDKLVTVEGQAMVPGSIVRHALDRTLVGIAVAVTVEAVTIVWSQPVVRFAIQDIKTTVSQKLRAAWRVETAEDVKTIFWAPEDTW